MRKQHRDIMQRLLKVAYQVSHPFCTACDKKTEMEICTECLSMQVSRKIPSVGVGPSIDWVLDHILKIHSNFSLSILFDKVLDESKELTTINNTIFTSSTLIRKLFPACYAIMLRDFEENLFHQGRLMRIKSKLYWADDLEEWLDERERTAATLTH